MLRPPLPRHLLRLGKLGRRNAFGNYITCSGTELVSTCSCEVVPHMSENVILWNTNAKLVLGSEGPLGSRMPLPSGLAVPLRPLGRVQRDASAFLVQETDVVLGIGMPICS